MQIESDELFRQSETDLIPKKSKALAREFITNGEIVNIINANNDIKQKRRKQFLPSPPLK